MRCSLVQRAGGHKEAVLCVAVNQRSTCFSLAIKTLVCNKMWNQGYTETSMAGGYTQSPGGGFASPAMSQSEKKGQRTRATQIIPCTVSQLMTATHADETFKVGDVEVSQVTLVGIIRSTDKSMTNIQYKVDDMTCAPMDVKLWVDMEDSNFDNNVLPPGTYVKVSGNLRSFQNHRSVVAFSIRPLEDMNELTSHMLEVVQAHMVLGKPQTMTSSAGGMSSSSMMTRPGMDRSYSGASDMTNNGLSGNQNQVLSLIRGSTEARGISIQELKQRLSGMSLPVIKQAVEFLSNEGHIFSTIDEDHFKSTDSDD